MGSLSCTPWILFFLMFMPCYSLTVLTPYEFSICDTSGPEFGEYQHGGVVCQVKMPKTNHFVSINMF